MLGTSRNLGVQARSEFLRGTLRTFVGFYPLLLQVRTQVLNDDLRATFERWYPGMKADPAPLEEAVA